MKYSDFPIREIPDRYLSRKKMLYEVGINDANYVTRPTIGDTIIRCPIYSLWYDILTRCYSDKFKIKNPTYIGCTIADEWHSFMSFRSWVLSQVQWEGLHLDKDLLSPGNKIYGPDTCIFVPEDVNKFLTFNRRNKTNLPIGVARNKGKYIAQLNCFNGNRWFSHSVETKDQASQLYWMKKMELAHELAAKQSNPIVAQAIINNIRSNYEINCKT